MSSQAEKYHLGMSGEYFVAAQLHRRGVSASVTFGNAKNADVIVFREGSDRVVVVEVKTTRQPMWTFNGRITANSEKPWVFVHLPETNEEPPRYFVLTQTNLHAILAPLDEEWCIKYEKKHGVEFAEKIWMVNVNLEWLLGLENKWGVISNQLTA